MSPAVPVLKDIIVNDQVTWEAELKCSLVTLTLAAPDRSCWCLARRAAVAPCVWQHTSLQSLSNTQTHAPSAAQSLR
jgi:hypothetical protein